MTLKICGNCGNRVNVALKHTSDIIKDLKTTPQTHSDSDNHQNSTLSLCGDCGNHVKLALNYTSDIIIDLKPTLKMHSECDNQRYGTPKNYSDSDKQLNSTFGDYSDISIRNFSTRGYVVIAFYLYIIRFVFIRSVGAEFLADSSLYLYHKS